MAVAKLKTQKTKASVSSFLNSIPDAQKKKDAKTLLALMKKVTKEKPFMWGTSIVGFGDWHYKYASGREGDFFITGFSPRVTSLTVYIMPGYKGYADLMAKLGPHKTGVSCLYLKSLSQIHMPTLKKLIERGWKDMQKKYPHS